MLSMGVFAAGLVEGRANKRNETKPIESVLTSGSMFVLLVCIES
jgi:hypothetical protein